MDIAAFYNPEKTTKIELTNPITGEGIGVHVEVRSSESEHAEEVEEAIIMENARFARENPEAMISVKTIRAQNVRRLAALIVTWDWGKNTFADMGVPKSSDEDKIKVLGHPAMKVFLPQIRKAAGSTKNFIQD